MTDFDNMKPRIRVPAVTRMIGRGVPDDAQPGDLIIGNRGAAAEVLASAGVIFLHYVGNWSDHHIRIRNWRRVYAS